MNVTDIVRKNGALHKAFSIGRLELKRFEGLESGCCLACTLLFLARGSGQLLAEAVRQFEAIDDAEARRQTPLVLRAQQIMAEQCQVSHNKQGALLPRAQKNQQWFRWMERLGPRYGLVSEEEVARASTISALPGTLHDWVAGKKGAAIIGMNGGPGVAGHAVGIDLDLTDGRIAFFEPNFGLFALKPNHFGAFLEDFFHFDSQPEYEFDRWVGVRFLRAASAAPSGFLQQAGALLAGATR